MHVTHRNDTNFSAHQTLWLRLL